MNIISLSDIHGNASHIEVIAGELAQADIVLLSGDITNFGNSRDAREVIEAIRPYNTNILAVPGNCDPPDACLYFDEQQINLHARAVLRDGITFIGLGGSVPCPGRTPNEHGEATLTRWLNAAATDITDDSPVVLLCHQPPYGTATDITRAGQHVGSDAVRAFIEAQQPLLCFTGHIHESPAVDTIGPTNIINPGPLSRGGYAYARVTSAGVELLEIRHP